MSGVNFFLGVCLVLDSSGPFSVAFWALLVRSWRSPRVLSGQIGKQLPAGSTLPNTPSQTSQQGFRTDHLIPNSIFLNTAWNKPSISQQQLAEDQAGPPWFELWWKQMRVRISENLSSFRPLLILIFFSNISGCQDDKCHTKRRLLASQELQGQESGHCHLPPLLPILWPKTPRFSLWLLFS